MGDRRHIAVATDTSCGYSRGLLQGAVRYALIHGWRVTMRSLWGPAPDLNLAEFRGDGVIAEVNSPERLDQLQRLRVPVVDVGNHIEGLPFPAVWSDDHQVGRLAAEHFLALGHRRFVYAGFDRHDGHRRRAGFVARLTQAGFADAIHEEQAYTGRTGQWVCALPKPLAVLAITDGVAADVIETCRELGVPVPEQVAILGVDDDAFLANLQNPTISSVAIPSDKIGYEAAALLDRLMSGELPPTAPILIPPTGVVVRGSTDALAIGDEDVAAALRFIREHVEQPTAVEDVLQQVPASRRSLERRFRTLLGRSILDELHRVHTDRAKRLLAETDLTAAQVAHRSGFPNVNRFNIVFKRQTGQTPTAFRASTRRR